MLVGREAERAEIRRLLAGARVGRSGVLTVTGDPGIGKTVLLEAAVAEADGMRVLPAAGSRPERDIAFGGLLQLLRPALDLLGSIPEPQADALAVALALREGEVADRFAVGAATLSLLSRYAEERPVLVVVDDVHLLDRPSADALVFAGRRLTADRVALLATARPEPGVPLLDAGLPVLRLGGLTLVAGQELLGRPTCARLGDELTARLHRATAGNPLAMLELAGDADRLTRLPPTAPLPPSEALAEAYGRRIRALDPAARLALLLCAICDGDLAVAAAAGRRLGADLGTLAAAEEQGLVRLTAGRAEFRHPLVRSSAYAAAPAATRRRVHAAVADVLPEADRDRRTWHLSEATVGPDEAVAARLDELARRSRGQSGYDVAATAFERAGLLTEPAGPRAERLVAAGEAAWLAGQVVRAGALLDTAERLISPPELRGRVAGIRGHMAMQAGKLDHALALLTRAAGELEAGDPDAAVMLLADAIDACCLLGDAAAARDLAGQVGRVVAGASGRYPRIRARLAVGMASTLAGRPGGDEIRAAVADLLALPEWRHDAIRPAWMIMGPLFLRESGAGRTAVRTAVEALRAQTALGTLPAVLTYLARDDATTDRWESAAAGYQEAVELAAEFDQPTTMAMARAGLAWLRARTGRGQECMENAAEALRLGEARGINLARVWATLALGELALCHGEAAEAATRLSAAQALLTGIGLHDVDLFPGPELAEALTLLGRHREARRVAVDHARRARGKGQPWALARAERALGITGGGDLRHFETAASLHAATPDTFEAARTDLACGAALRRAKQRAAARPWLRRALAGFEDLGARPWADAAAQELNATGETVRRRGDRYRDLLTPQELRVARLLGAGRTTREAAAALFLSPKTVEYHLRHVYAKLRIRSRSELAEALASGGPTGGEGGGGGDDRVEVAVRTEPGPG